MKENRVLLQNVHYSLRELGEAPGRLLFFPQARSKLFQNVHYSLGKRRAAQGTPASDPRGDCEGPELGEER